MQRRHNIHKHATILLCLILPLAWQWSVGCAIEITCREDSDCQAPARCALGQCKVCVSDIDCRTKPGTRCNLTTFLCTSGVDGGAIEGEPQDEAQGVCIPGASEACYSGPATSRKRGTCSDGERSCRASRTWGPCVGEKRPTSESCNGKDDDCDGQIDEVLQCQGLCAPKAQETCYTGSTRNRDIGVCTSGNRTCNADRKWGPCTDSVLPSPEICDRKDNDCNGKIDDISTSPPLCGIQKGVCAGATKICTTGRWADCTATEYTKKSSSYEATETKCDKLDNDCDGQIDEKTKGCVSTLAGNRAGFKDDKGTAALFKAPRDIYYHEPTNILLVVDSGNNSIRQIDTDANVTTFAGGLAAGHADGTGTKARFNGPSGIAFTESALYVADTGNHRIRKIDTNGSVTTYSGLVGANPLAGYSDGDPSEAKYSSPQGIAVGPNGNLYVADTNNHAIRYIDAGGDVTTVAGTCTTTSCKKGFLDGSAEKALFNSPKHLAFLGNDQLLIADTNNHCIRVFDLTKDVVGTYAGKCGSRGSLDGTRTSRATFYLPTNIAIDSTGKIYIADRGNNRIRQISGNTVSTFAGSGTPGSTDGPLTTARFHLPTGLAISSSGDLYSTCEGSSRIRLSTQK